MTIALNPTRRRHLAGLAALPLLGLATAAKAGDTDAYLGTWSGVLDGQLHFRLDIVSPTEVHLVSLDQGGAELHARTVSLTAQGLTIAFDIGATYSAHLADDGTLTGAFTNAGRTFTLTFKRGDLYRARPTLNPEPLTPQVLTRVRQTFGMPAVGAAFAHDAGPATVWADGLRSADAQVAVTPDDQWHLGSITKSFTATLAARIFEQHTHLTWDTTVGEVLGTRMPDMNPAYRAVTFRHLLSHRSRLPYRFDRSQMVPFPSPGEPGADKDPRPDRLRWAQGALKDPPASTPGTQMLYTNSGYIVAGAMLETVLGKTWEDLIREQVFGPLKLASAGFFAPGTPGKLDQPLGHTPKDDNPDIAIPVPLGPGSDNFIAMAASGQIHISLRDLIAYLNAHLTQPSDYLSAESWHILHTPPFGGDYAMGWFITSKGHLFHDGTNHRWYACVTIDPQNRRVAAVATNEDREDQEYAVKQLLDDALLT